MNITMHLSQDEICDAVQDYVDQKLKPLSNRRPRAKFVAQEPKETGSSRRLFSVEVHFEDG